MTDPKLHTLRDPEGERLRDAVVARTLAYAECVKSPASIHEALTIGIATSAHKAMLAAGEEYRAHLAKAPKACLWCAGNGCHLMAAAGFAEPDPNVRVPCSQCGATGLAKAAPEPAPLRCAPPEGNVGGRDQHWLKGYFQDDAVVATWVSTGSWMFPDGSIMTPEEVHANCWRYHSPCIPDTRVQPTRKAIEDFSNSFSERAAQLGDIVWEADIILAALAHFTAPARVEPDSSWACAARKQSLPEPADCNWPFCGCDEKAIKVIQALEECGAIKNDFSPTQPAPQKVDHPWNRECVVCGNKWWDWGDDSPCTVCLTQPHTAQPAPVQQTDHPISIESELELSNACIGEIRKHLREGLNFSPAFADDGVLFAVGLAQRAVLAGLISDAQPEMQRRWSEAAEGYRKLHEEALGYSILPAQPATPNTTDRNGLEQENASQPAGAQQTDEEMDRKLDNLEQWLHQFWLMGTAGETYKAFHGARKLVLEKAAILLAKHSPKVNLSDDTLLQFRDIALTRDGPDLYLTDAKIRLAGVRG